MSKELFILRSVPGAGKSTVAELIAGENGMICCADDYFYEKYGEYKWSVEELGSAHSYCKEKAENAMKNAFSNSYKSTVVIANTNSTSSDYKPYVEMAEKYGFRVHFLVIENRHGGINEHNVPDAALLKMDQRIKSNIKLI